MLENIDWAMGQHGIYVWSTYGVAAILLFGTALYSRARFNKVKQQLQRRYQNEELAEK